MLLPLLNCLSLSDREGDANGDSAPLHHSPPYVFFFQCVACKAIQIGERGGGVPRPTIRHGLIGAGLTGRPGKGLF